MAGIAICCFIGITNAQKVITSQDFEALEKKEDILSLDRDKFNTWGKSTWTVTEKKGKGFNDSDKFATSGDEVNATLVKYRNLEVGETYVFSVAVKMTNADVNWKTNYAVKVLSGKEGDMHFYVNEQLKEPRQDKWQLHEGEFTVIEGRENICLQVYRWAEGVKMHVDNFKLVKI